MPSQGSRGRCPSARCQSPVLLLQAACVQVSWSLESPPPAGPAPNTPRGFWSIAPSLCAKRYAPPCCGRLWRGLTCGGVRRHRRGSGLPLPSPAATLRCFSLCPCGPHPPLQAVAPACSPAYFQMSLPHLLQTALCSELPPSPTTPQWDLLVFRRRLSPPWAEGSLQRSSTSCSCCRPL